MTCEARCSLALTGMIAGTRDGSGLIASLSSDREQMRAPSFRTATIGHDRSVEFGALGLGIAENGAGQVGAFKICPPKIGAMKICAEQVDARKRGSTQIGSRQ